MNLDHKMLIKFDEPLLNFKINFSSHPTSQLTCILGMAFYSQAECNLYLTF